MGSISVFIQQIITFLPHPDRFSSRYESPASRLPVTVVGTVVRQAPGVRSSRVTSFSSCLFRKCDLPYYRIGLHKITSLNFPAYCPPVHPYLPPFYAFITQLTLLFFVLYAAFRMSRFVAFATTRAVKAASMPLPV